jgi:D-arabinose 1-dehydrogenase-like Zn-dependent alcohol dehydrogenase
LIQRTAVESTTDGVRLLAPKAMSPSDIELIKNDQINNAYERMLKGDVRYRFVTGSASLT